MYEVLDIPRRGGGLKNPDGFYARMREINPGGYIMISKDKRKSVYSWANDLGIKIKTRSMGSSDTVRVYHAGFIDELSNDPKS